MSSGLRRRGDGDRERDKAERRKAVAQQQTRAEHEPGEQRDRVGAPTIRDAAEGAARGTMIRDDVSARDHPTLPSAPVPTSRLGR